MSNGDNNISTLSAHQLASYGVSALIFIENQMATIAHYENYQVSMKQNKLGDEFPVKQNNWPLFDINRLIDIAKLRAEAKLSRFEAASSSILW